MHSHHLPSVSSHRQLVAETSIISDLIPVSRARSIGLLPSSPPCSPRFEGPPTMSTGTPPAPHAADARHLLVIGAGPGIGAATARRFARDGYRVTLAARQRDKLEELADELRSIGAEVATVRIDAADPWHLRAALSELYTAPNPPGVVLY